jgi:ABC-type taurine transport system ATPase subunit
LTTPGARLGKVKVEVVAEGMTEIRPGLIAGEQVIVVGRSPCGTEIRFKTRSGFVAAFEGSADDQRTTAVNVKVPSFDFGLIRKRPRLLVPK